MQFWIGNRIRNDKEDTLIIERLRKGNIIGVDLHGNILHRPLHRNEVGRKSRVSTTRSQEKFDRYYYESKTKFVEALKRYNISIRENWELMNFECREQTQKDYNNVSLRFCTKCRDSGKLNLKNSKEELYFVRNSVESKTVLCYGCIGALLKMNEWLRSSRLDVFCRKGIFRSFAKFIGKHLCESLFFNKVRPARDSAQVFPVSLAKFLRPPFYKDHLQWLLLKIVWYLLNSLSCSSFFIWAKQPDFYHLELDA